MKCFECKKEDKLMICSKCELKNIKRYVIYERKQTLKEVREWIKENYQPKWAAKAYFRNNIIVFCIFMCGAIANLITSEYPFIIGLIFWIFMYLLAMVLYDMFNKDFKVKQ
jgi:hypothetical protein